MVPSVFITFAVNVLPLKENIMSFIGIQPYHVTRVQNWTIVAAICLFSVTLSIIYPKASDWFGLIGALFGSFLIFLFPCKLTILIQGLAFYRTHKDKEGFKILSLFSLIWGATFTIIGIICTIVLFSAALGYNPNW